MAASLEYPNQFNVHRRPLPTGVQPVDYLSHSRSRTISSNVLPPNHHHHHQSPPPPLQSSRRTLSNATSSTTSTANSSIGRTPTGGAQSSYASSIRRSTSSRSNNTPSSYVALMRKQKATVWCDRAQHEDPRILAQQRAAKMRAQMEVVGGVSATGGVGRSAASSGGGIASKIRHHGAVKASAYSAAGNLSGGGVPMRLSASEVDEENSDDENSVIARYQNRNGSGRSSLNSGHRQSYYGGPTPTGTRFSNGGTPPSRHSYSPVDRERQPSASSAITYQDETPVPGASSSMHGGDYFSQSGGNGDSDDSAEEQRFGDVGGLPRRESVQTGYGAEQQRQTSDDLRRRGSVDDRTTHMNSVRLFVANPDMDDD